MERIFTHFPIKYASTDYLPVTEPLTLRALLSPFARSMSLVIHFVSQSPLEYLVTAKMASRQFYPVREMTPLFAPCLPLLSITRPQEYPEDPLLRSPTQKRPT